MNQARNRCRCMFTESGLVFDFAFEAGLHGCFWF